MITYKIIRFYDPASGQCKHVIIRGLTLEQAQEHCRQTNTHGVTKVGGKQVKFFDGYMEEVE